MKSLKEIRINQPFANYPIQCTECGDLVYRYAFEQHFKARHPAKEISSHLKVSAAEKRLVKKKNFNSKMAMSVAEVNKLKDAELALFPAKDFFNIYYLLNNFTKW